MQQLSLFDQANPLVDTLIEKIKRLLLDEDGHLRVPRPDYEIQQFVAETDVPGAVLDWLRSQIELIHTNRPSDMHCRLAVIGEAYIEGLEQVLALLTRQPPAYPIPTRDEHEALLAMWVYLRRLINQVDSPEWANLTEADALEFMKVIRTSQHRLVLGRDAVKYMTLVIREASAMESVYRERWGDDATAERGRKLARLKTLRAWVDRKILSGPEPAPGSSELDDRLNGMIFDSEVMMQEWTEAAVDDLIAWLRSNPDRELLVGRGLEIIDRQIQIDRENMGADQDVVNPGLEALTGLRARIAELGNQDGGAKAKAINEATALFFGTFFAQSDHTPAELSADEMVSFVKTVFESGHYPVMRDQILADSQAMIDALNLTAEKSEDAWVLDAIRANIALRQRLVFCFTQIDVSMHHMAAQACKAANRAVQGPAAMKKRIEAILKGHGLLAAFQTQMDFFVRIVDRSKTFNPLTIQKNVLPDGTWEVIVCHPIYLDGPCMGDIIKDPEIVFNVPWEGAGWWPVEITQNLPLENNTRRKFFEVDGVKYVNRRFHNQVSPLVTQWTRELKFGGYHNPARFEAQDSSGCTIIAVVDDSDLMPEEEACHE